MYLRWVDCDHLSMMALEGGENVGTYVNPGNQAFSRIIGPNYVDKTNLIALMNERVGGDESLVCCSRPRRFGKSYAAKMLTAYYDCSCDSHELFADKVIAESDSYEEYLNQYNVICLDISGFISVAKREKVDLADVPLRIASAIKAEVLEIDPEAPKDKGLEDCLIHCVDLPDGRDYRREGQFFDEILIEPDFLKTTLDLSLPMWYSLTYLSDERFSFCALFVLYREAMPVTAGK